MRDIENIIERMKQVTETKTDLELAAVLGIRSNTISTWRKRQSIPYEHLDHLAQAKSIPLDWFLAEGSAKTCQRGVPLLRSLPQNWPDICAEDIETYLHLPEARPSQWALRVRGQSMAPTVQHGDLVLFEKDAEIQNAIGNLVVARSGMGEVLVRWLRERNDQWFLVSDNPEYGTVPIAETDEVLGQVQAIWRCVKF
jgi:SOS-response transcriptional repressor LexA